MPVSAKAVYIGDDQRFCERLREEKCKLGLEGVSIAKMASFCPQKLLKEEFDVVYLDFSTGFKAASEASRRIRADYVLKKAVIVGLADTAEGVAMVLKAGLADICLCKGAELSDSILHPLAAAFGDDEIHLVLDNAKTQMELPTKGEVGIKVIHYTRSGFVFEAPALLKEGASYVFDIPGIAKMLPNKRAVISRKVNCCSHYNTVRYEARFEYVDPPRIDPRMSHGQRKAVREYHEKEQKEKQANINHYLKGKTGEFFPRKLKVALFAGVAEEKARAIENLDFCEVHLFSYSQSPGRSLKEISPDVVVWSLEKRSKEDRERRIPRFDLASLQEAVATQWGMKASPKFIVCRASFLDPSKLGELLGYPNMLCLAGDFSPEAVEAHLREEARSFRQKSELKLQRVVAKRNKSKTPVKIPESRLPTLFYPDKNSALDSGSVAIDIYLTALDESTCVVALKNERLYGRSSLSLSYPLNVAMYANSFDMKYGARVKSHVNVYCLIHATSDRIKQELRKCVNKLIFDGDLGSSGEKQ